MSFPPVSSQPLARQQAMANACAAEFAYEGGSTASWSLLPDDQSSVQHPEPKAPPPGFRPGDRSTQPVQGDAPGAVPTSADAGVPGSSPQEAPRSSAQSSAAPATQAARDLLDSAQRQADRLSKQKRASRWGQMPASNARNFQRSMEARISEGIAEAAVTPQCFLDQVQGAVGPFPTAGQPVSYGPPPVIEEVHDC
eukprot:s3333_g2.t1